MCETVIRESFAIRADDYAAAGQASATIKRTLKQLGIDSTVLRRVAVACYEAELNMVIHSLGGTLALEVDPAQVRLLSKDIGPGIQDIEKAMTEGFSTAGEKARQMGFGAGMGLPNMKRNASQFHISSTPGVGTSIVMTFDLVNCEGALS